MGLELLIWLQGMRCGVMDTIMSLITKCGEELIILIIFTMIYWCVDKKKAEYLAFCAFFMSAFNGLLKMMFRIKRPWILDQRIKPVPAAFETATGYSFPSLHTAFAVTFYGGIACKSKKNIVRVLLWIVAALVSFSRLYLGVHSPLDVLMSIVVSIALLIVMNFVLKFVESGKNHDIIVYIGIMVVCVVAIVVALVQKSSLAEGGSIVVDSIKGAGVCAGFISGWLLERRIIQFDVTAKLWQQAVKYVVGLLLAVVLLKGIKAPLVAILGIYGDGFVRYFITLFFILAVWPFFFSKIFGKKKT